MRRVLLIFAVIAFPIALAGCGGSPAPKTTGEQVLACAAINKLAGGAYSNDSAAQQNQEAQTTIGMALESEDGDLTADAEQLQTDIGADNQSGVTTDIENLQQRCIALGLGSNSGNTGNSGGNS